MVDLAEVELLENFDNELADKLAEQELRKIEREKISFRCNEEDL